MTQTISPARALNGRVRLPGDKGISHRYAMLSALAEGVSRIHSYATGEDCHSTLSCLRALGVDMEVEGSTITIQGRGPEALRGAEEMLDAGNSGSTMRMLGGILAGLPFRSSIGGDASLSRRPMGRIIKPLGEMGVRVDAREGQYAPLTIHGGGVRPIEYTTPVASAQVKSCVLFAGMFAHGSTVVHESIPTRDHSEIALREFGATVEFRPKYARIEGPARLAARTLTVPGDISSAAFFLAAALIVPEADIVIEGVGLNPARAVLLDYLKSIGARIEIQNFEHLGGEPVADLRVRTSTITAGLLEGATTAALIDEVPVLAVLAAKKGGLRVKDAAEMRVKETDRIATVVENFRRLGLEIEPRHDGFDVPGAQTFRPAAFDSFGDHRIAMAFAVAALAAEDACTIENAEAASVSFPEFYQTLARLRN